MASATIEEALHYKLVNEATVIAEVGTRIYWLESKQKPTLPYVTYFVVSDVYGGLAFGRTDAGNARIQINVYDNSVKNVLRVGDIIRDTLDQYSGTVDSVVITSINCSGTHCIKVPDQEMYMGTFDALVRYDDI